MGKKWSIITFVTLVIISTFSIIISIFIDESKADKIIYYVCELIERLMPYWLTLSGFVGTSGIIKKYFNGNNEKNIK